MVSAEAVRQEVVALDVHGRRRVTLYVGQQCGLCEEARRMVALIQSDLPLDVQEVDIASDEALEKRWLLEIPVLVENDTVVANGAMTYVELYDYFFNE